MSLRWKFTIALLVLFAVTTTATQYLHRRIVFKSYEQLEQQLARRDMERAVAALNREIAQLEVFCKTWSAWDDAYTFVQHPTPEFIQANMVRETFINNDLDVIWWRDANDRFVWGECRDGDHGGDVMPIRDFGYLVKDPANRLGHFTNSSQKTSGILLTSRGIMMIVAQPVLTGQNKGPIMGTLIVGRLLLQEDIAHLVQQTKVRLKFWPDDSRAPDNLSKIAAAETALAEPGGMWVKALDESLHVYTRVPDVAGRNGIVLCAEVPRDITQQGTAALNFLTLSTTAQAALTLAVWIVVMQRLVIRPLAMVKDFAVNVGRGALIPLMPAALFRKDEIGTLANEFQQMIARLEESRSQLQLSKDAAELASAQAQQAREEAISASRAKGEFLARMSHEIRTPLTGLVGTVGLLEQTELSAAQRHYARLAQQAASGLVSVISDILDFSKMEAGKVELERIPFDLHKLLCDITELVTPVANQKRLTLGCVLAPDLPRWLAGDSVRIQQIVNNLVANALKFTPAGSVSIRAVRLDENSTAGKCRLRVEVTDTGIGIPADRIDRLFESFSQVESSTTRRFGGTGLGLAICKRLIELMGGRIGVNSRAGQGTTFWFELDLEVAQAHPQEPTTAAWDVETTLGLHVLVAEDNGMNQFIIEETLKRFGCTWEIVENGKLAVVAVGRIKFDAVLMDCQMPELDGLEATRQIRACESAAGAARIVIVALTADALSGDLERCLAAGMDDYVSKPIDATQLFRVLKAVKSTAAHEPVLVTHE